MEKIKLSFEPTDSWNREEFRNLITLIKRGELDGWIFELDKDTGIKKRCGKNYEYELWIITTNSSSSYINALADQLSIPTERVILCINDTTKIVQIIDNADIHLDMSQVIITALTPTTVRGILVDNKIAYQAIGLKYIQDITKWTDVILRERNEGEKIKPC